MKDHSHCQLSRQIGPQKEEGGWGGLLKYEKARCRVWKQFSSLCSDRWQVERWLAMTTAAWRKRRGAGVSLGGWGWTLGTGRLTSPNFSRLPCLFSVCACSAASARWDDVGSLPAGQGGHRELGFIALIVAKSQLITDRAAPRGHPAQTETGRRMSRL